MFVIHPPPPHPPPSPVVPQSCKLFPPPWLFPFCCHFPILSSAGVQWKLCSQHSQARGLSLHVTSGTLVRFTFPPLIRPPLVLSLCLSLSVDALPLAALVFVYPERKGGRKVGSGQRTNRKHLEVRATRHMLMRLEMSSQRLVIKKKKVFYKLEICISLTVCLLQCKLTSQSFGILRSNQKCLQIQMLQEGWVKLRWLNEKHSALLKLT